MNILSEILTMIATLALVGGLTLMFYLVVRAASIMTRVLIESNVAQITSMEHYPITVLLVYVLIIIIFTAPLILSTLA